MNGQPPVRAQRLGWPLLAGLSLLSACAAPGTPGGGPVGTPTAVASDALSTATGASCAQAAVIERVRGFLGERHVQHDVGSSLLNGHTVLNVWYVDDSLDPAGAAVPATYAQAVAGAARVGRDLLAVDACVASAFAYINPVVVDRDYNGWFSGVFSTDVLGSASADADPTAHLARSFFARVDAPPAPEPAPAGGCDWGESQADIRQRLGRLDLAPGGIIGRPTRPSPSCTATGTARLRKSAGSPPAPWHRTIRPPSELRTAPIRPGSTVPS